MIAPFLPSTIEFMSVPIYIYGLLHGIAGALVIYGVDKKYGDRFTWYDYLLLSVSAVFGARLLYVVTHPTELSMFWDLSGGGRFIYGAFIFGTIAIYWISKKRDISFIKLLDWIVLWLPFAQAIARWGNFFNQELYGKPLDAWYALYIDPSKRLEGYEQYDTYHPLFFYESILNLLNGVLVLLLYKRYSKFKGLVLSVYFFNYSCIRLFLNTIRLDLTYVLDGRVEINGLIALVICIMSAMGIYKITKR